MVPDEISADLKKKHRLARGLRSIKDFFVSSGLQWGPE